MGRSSPAKIFHVFGIVGQIFGQAFHRAGKIARKIVTGRCTGWRLLVQLLFQTLPYEPGFRHSSRLRLAGELRQEIIGQFK